jgi:hypothetical protein
VNIFILDSNPILAAQYAVDRHVVKMVLESAQLLSTAHHVTDKTDAHPDLYKKTHENHPCSVWARKSSANYDWLYNFFQCQHDEFMFRYGKTHLSYTKLNGVFQHVPANIPKGALTPFAQAMPDQYRNADPVVAYRAYYNGEKRELFNWKNRSIPEWITT